ncbi:unnamed protein product, partial [marine sediment metagenome]
LVYFCVIRGEPGRFEALPEEARDAIKKGIHSASITALITGGVVVTLHQVRHTW